MGLTSLNGSQASRVPYSGKGVHRGRPGGGVYILVQIQTHALFPLFFLFFSLILYMVGIYDGINRAG